MNDEVGQHPGFFLFLNRLRTSIFEHSRGVVLQANAGKADKPTVKSAAAKRLEERASQAEEDYANGLMSPSELLTTVANHYDDDKILAAFEAMQEANEAYEDQASQDEPEPELTVSEDEVRIIDDAEDGPARLTDNWVTTTWSGPEAANAQGNVNNNNNNQLEDKVTDPREVADKLKHLTRFCEVNDLIEFSCNICSNVRTSFQVLTGCGHAFCSACIRPETRSCFQCRGPIGTTVTMHTSSLNAVWKEEFRDGNDANRVAGNDANRVADAEAGHRPADVGWAERLEQESEEIAREMQERGGIYSSLTPGLFLTPFLTHNMDDLLYCL